jgi:hypothetical protein
VSGSDAVQYGKPQHDRGIRSSAPDLHRAILNSDAVARVKAAHGSWLLPQAYPEGCPTPSLLPGGARRQRRRLRHGAQGLLQPEPCDRGPARRQFDGARLEAWRGDELALGGEIDKLASNIAVARDAAFVHFRSDSIEGLKLGEEVEIALVAETSRTCYEAFDGFVLSRFDGSKVRISNGDIRPD